LQQEAIWYDDAQTREADTTYTYDPLGYGNITKITVGGSDVTSRSTTIVFDTQNRFPIQKQVEAQLTPTSVVHTTQFLFDHQFGGLKASTDPNLLTTTWTY